jgi:two-component system KDP operon response regulator KdpE
MSELEARRRNERGRAWPPRAPLRVLVVEDEPVIARMVELTLNHGSYVARTAADAHTAAALLAEWRPHLVVADMDVDGGRIVERVTGDQTAGRVPVLALTRRGDMRAKLEAFDRGVEDIMTVPFSPEELVARALVLTRRAHRDAAARFTPVIRIGELEIDILHRTVTAGGHALHLTSLEQSLLYLLAANAGRVVTREEILDVLWGPDYVAESNVVDRQVRNLRARLQNDWRRPRFIATVPGKGYRFVPATAGADDASGDPS